MTMLKSLKRLKRCGRYLQTKPSWILLTAVLALLWLVLSPSSPPPSRKTAENISGQVLEASEMTRELERRLPLERDLMFQVVGSEQGLSGSTVTDILQDRQGFLWVATDDGAARYDGKEFRVYRHVSGDAQSISHNDIRALYEDSAGNMWIGTSGGLNRFDRKQERFIRYALRDDENSETRPVVTDIAEGEAGQLWIGTSDGLYRLEPDSGDVVRYRHDPENPQSISNNQVYTVCVDHAGTLWVGTKAGLNVYHAGIDQFLQYRHDADDAHSLPSDEVFVLYEDHAHALWIGTPDGLGRFDADMQEFQTFRHDPDDPDSLGENRVLALYEDRADLLWVGTEGGGLNVFDRDQQRFVRHRADTMRSNGLSSNFISALFEDRAGNLWIGSYGGGLYKLHRESVKFLHYSYAPYASVSLSHAAVSAIMQDSRQNLWVGTYGGGITVIDWDANPRTTRYYRHNPDDPRSLSHDTIWAIIQDHDGVIWIGTEGGGLNRFIPETDDFTQYRFNPSDPYSLNSDAVSAIYEDRQGLLWIGTMGGGLNWFDRTTGRFYHSLPTPDAPDSAVTLHSISAIAEDRAGNLWVGTFGGGVSVLNRKTERFTHYQQQPDQVGSFSNNTVWSIYEDRQGVVWIGTSGGLNKFDSKHHSFTQYRKIDGLPSDVIMGIVADTAENLWLSTDHGLGLFNPQTTECKIYDQRDGLLGDKFSPKTAIANEHGELFFGGEHGLNAFFPQTLRDNPHVPSIVITDFQLFNQSIRPGETCYIPSKKMGGQVVQKALASPLQAAITETQKIVLPYNADVFQFSFAALDFSLPEKNQYAYMMDGFDREWIYAGARNTVQYTSLPAGRYTFRVKGSNNDGLWNDEGTSIDIQILPPLWGTWFFRFLLVAALAGGYIMRVHKIKQVRKILEVKVDERTRELRANMRRLEDEILERQHAENALKKSEEYNRVLIETMNEALVVIDTSQCIIYVNSKFCEMFGYSRAEIIGAPATHCLTQEHLNVFYQKHATSQDRRIEPYTIEWVRKDGSRITSITSPQVLFDSDGKMSGAVAVITDITELQHAEQELREAQAFTESILQNVPEVIYSTDGNLNLTYMSPKCEQLYGYSVDEFFHTPDLFSKLIHPDDQERVIEQLRTVINGEMAFAEYRVRTKDGRTLWVRESAIPTRDERGHLKRIDASVYDITELKQAEKALDEERNLLRTLIDNIPDVVYVKDLTGRYVTVNKAFVNLVNAAGERELLGKTAFSILPEDDAQALTDLEQRIYRNGRPVIAKEHFYKDVAGHSMWASKTIVPLRDNSDEIFALLGITRDITEHKQAEELLKESEERHRLLIESMQEGMVVLDNEAAIEYVNNRLCEMLGREREQILHRPVTDFADDPNIPELRERFLAGSRAVAQTYEVSLIKKDGTRVACLISPQALVDCDGQRTGSFAVITDISAVKKAERETSYLAAIIEGTADAAVIKDLDLKIIAVNAAYLKQAGKTLHDVIGKTETEVWQGMVDADMLRQWEEESLQVQRLAPGEVLSKEETYPVWNGERCTILVNNFPIFDKRGTLIATADISTDITERKVAEEALRDSEEKYRSLFENLQDVFYRADNEGNLVLVSPSCKNIFGYAAEQAIGLNLSRDLYANTRQRERFLAEIRKHGYVENYEIQLRREDGTMIWGNVNSHFYRDNDGNVLGVEGTVIDITARKQAEEQLIDANVELRTTLDNLKRTQNHLIQAEKMAALGQLIAGVAHEINTPLGAIQASIGNITSALDETTHQLPKVFQYLLLEEQTLFLEFIECALQAKKHLTSREERKLRQNIRRDLEERELARADEIADTLVDMGIYADIEPYLPLLRHEQAAIILQTAYNLVTQRYNSDNILIAIERAAKVVAALKYYSHTTHSDEMSKASLTRSLDTVLTLYHNQLKHGIEVTKHYDDIPDLLCYPDELNQVWTNLVQNAIHAMYGKGTLHVEVRQRASEVFVHITDSGSGIPPEIQTRIFEPFFTTKAAGEGTGLGLDICRSIIEKHNGRIELDSEPGRTTFSIVLPMS